MIFDVEVIVVGAGPAGLLLAGDLAQAGVSCAVFERRTGRSGLTRAFTVYARTLEQLDARGMADELVACGTPLPEFRFFAGAAVDLSLLPSRFPYLLVTPQYETERVLEERARRMGADIRYASEVTGFTQHPDGVEVKVRQDGSLDRVVRAGWIVGADGMHSTVRQALGMPFPGRPVVRSVMLAEVRLTQPPPDALTLNAIGDAFALIAPFGDGWYRIIAWQRHNQPPEDVPVALDEVSEVTRQVFGTDYGMHEPRWMSRFHSEERQVPRYRDGFVLLAGDAAHAHSPAGGQGMNTSIQDAANLGWKLAATVHGWAPPGMLDTYHAERHPVGRQVLRGSGALLRLFTVPSALVAARNVLACAATRIPFVASRIAGAISGVGICYPAPPGAHPLAGKRVADLPLADGRRLYQALRGGRFLLAASPGALSADATSGYGDRVDAAPVAGASRTVALIRPDAYVAWAAAGDAATASQIRDSLARWCGSPGRLAEQIAVRFSKLRPVPDRRARQIRSPEGGVFMQTVAVLGLGKMGAATAGNIATAGFPTIVQNRTAAVARRHAEQIGARLALTPKQAAESADVVITMLADEVALDAVYHGPEGLLAGLRPGTVAVDMGTSGPAVIRALAPEVRAVGAFLVDAPVSGSAAAAQAGTLTILAGGDTGAITKVGPVFDAVGSVTHHVGALGAGAAMKLALNVIVHSIDQALAEALVLAERSGIPRAIAYEVFSQSAVASPVLAFRRDKFMDPGGAPTTFQISLARKDLQLARALARAVGVTLPQAEATMSVLQAAVESGRGGNDVTAVAAYLRDRARQSPVPGNA
jgi:3-hydroxyisobutyrate dehydrogenase-like beta-hydroxyacid dehydrogenase/2-polyprenyl-6-methoxyphenol hydroxylase-like FAD-dependent oxidoreductase